MHSVQSNSGFQGPRNQRGIGTLLVTLVVLVILTVIILSSTTVALFEQRTATNENRQRLADQAAEYALNLGGEFIKANVANIGSTQTDGWLASATSRWVTCNGVTLATHPCMAEPIQARRNELYFYSLDGTNPGAIGFDSLVPTGGKLATATAQGSAGYFGATATVNALLCRLDTTVLTGTVVTPTCRSTPNPLSSNRIAVTLIATSTLAGENSGAQAKETWANFDTFSTAAAAPLVASGNINGTGNVEIVTAANGGGIGVPVSIWDGGNADVDKTGGGSAASISTCQLGEFLKSTAVDNLKTTCSGWDGSNGTACGCPSVTNASTPDEAYAINPNFLSGKVPASNPACCENLDILDRDPYTYTDPISGVTSVKFRGVNPDITFFPGVGIDNFTVLDDDSLFEWVFNVSNEANTTRPNATTEGSGTGVTLTNCTVTAGVNPTGNCAIANLIDPAKLNAQSVTCAQLDALGANATGLYYVTDSSAATECDLPSPYLGSPDAPAIVVLNDKARLNNTVLFGMVFVRSTAKTAVLRGNGNSQVYGAVVVEGTADITGGLRLVYDDTSVSGPGKRLPETTRLGRVAGSWLDGSRGGF